MYREMLSSGSGRNSRYTSPRVVRSGQNDPCEALWVREDQKPRDVTASRPANQLECWLAAIGLLHLIYNGEHACGIKWHGAFTSHLSPYLRAIRVVTRVGMAAVGNDKRADQNEGQAVTSLSKAQEVPQKMPLIRP